MASYKVLQDIEAEDKILGWLTPRQLIYAAIVVVSIIISYRLAITAWYLAVPFLIPIVLFGFLAAPIGTEQSSELWLLAKIRFFLIPHRRIWDQSGIKELVTITAPKTLQKSLTNNLSQSEVQSRLEALASTIDSRGWAVKNVNVNLYAQSAFVNVDGDTDRLINPSSFPVDVPNYEIVAADDILDEQNNPTAQHLNQLITQSAQLHKRQAIDRMHESSPTASGQSLPRPDYWFMNESPEPSQLPDPSLSTFNRSQMVSPGQSEAPIAVPTPQITAAEEQALLKKIHETKEQPDPTHSHVKTILPIAEQQKIQREQLARQAVHETTKPSVTPPNNPDILNLANNDDLNVATIARQANKPRKDTTDGEVVITLR